MPSVLSLVIAAVFGSSLAIAQSSTHRDVDKKSIKQLSRFDEMFRAADTNGDGALTKKEASDANLHHIVEHFDRLDHDRDGRVTRDEIRALIRHRLTS